MVLGMVPSALGGRLDPSLAAPYYPPSPVGIDISNQEHHVDFRLPDGAQSAKQLNRKRPLALLSLDGGRWERLDPLSQIAILGNVLSSYEYDEGLDENTIKLCDVFDLIIGTGTGGLVACMLAILKMTIPETQDAYVRFHNSAFKSGSRTPEGRAADLRKALERVLDAGAGENGKLDGKLSTMKLKDIAKNFGEGCKFAVTAMSANNSSIPTLFRAYRGRNPSVECTLLEALLATLSDAESFPAVSLKQSEFIEEKFISSNLGHCNPTLDLINEVGSIFQQDAIAAIVSIGAGRPMPVIVDGPDSFTKAALQHSKDCQDLADAVGRRFSGHDNLYFRIEVDTLDLSTTWMTAGTVLSHSRAYLSQHQISNEIKELSQVLVQRPGYLKGSQLSGLIPGAIERIEGVVGNIDNQVESTRHFTILDKLVVSRDAPYTSDAAHKVQRRKCTAGTRVNILNSIMAWARDHTYRLRPSLFWIYGLAGTGKSTIVQSICEMLYIAGVRTSSYFCSIQLDSKEAKLIFPTIARHLASIFPPFAKHLASQLEDRPDRAFATLSLQFQDLLCGPWGAAFKDIIYQLPCVVVIDALDECDRGKEVLSLILDAIDENKLQGIRFLVTSRPVPILVERVRELNRGPQIALHEVSKGDVSGDIQRFLTEELDQKLNSDQIRRLAAHADGLFILASTLAKHLKSSRNLISKEVQERLSRILASPKQLGNKVGVDALYHTIVRNALCSETLQPHELRPRLQVLQAIMCAAETITLNTLSDLTRIDIEIVRGVVESLHSVLFISAQNGHIYVIHASFYDFVTSQVEEPFKCDRLVIQSQLASSCVTRMKEHLRFNICNIQSSFTIDDDLPPPINLIGESLAYACRHWWGHVKSCSDDVRKDMSESISEFLERKGLFWMEAMMLIGHERTCRDVWKDIATTPLMNPHSMRIRPLAVEAAKMASMFISLSPKITSQLYMSVLALWEGETVRCWKSQFHGLPRVASRRIDSVKDINMIWNVKSSVTCVAYSPDSERVVSGSSNSTVEIWDAESGQQLQKLEGHRNRVNSVAFSPDGKRVVSGSGADPYISFDPDDNTVRIWDSESGQQLKKLNGHKSKVNSVAFSPNGVQVVSGSSDNTVRVWDVEASHQLQRFIGHGSSVNSVAFSPDGGHLVSGSSDNTVRIWDAESGRQLLELNNKSMVNSVAFSPDGERVVSGSRDKTVRIWDAESGRRLQVLSGHRSEVNSVAFSPNGKRVVSVSGSELAPQFKDNTVRIWDAEYGQQLQKLNGHGFKVNSVAFSPNGERIVSGSNDNTVRIWDAEARQQLPQPVVRLSEVSSVTYSPSGKYIASGSRDEAVQIWDAVSGRQLQVLNSHGFKVNSVAFSPNGEHIVFGSIDNTVQIWDVETSQKLQQLTGHVSQVNSVAFSPNGKHVVSGSDDQTVRIWDADASQQLQQLIGHLSQVNSVAFSPNGKHLASGSSDSTVRTWDVESGCQLLKLDHESVVNSIAFSPDGEHVVSGSGDTTVQIWDAESGRQLQVLYTRRHSINSVSYSPDSKHIVFGSSSHDVRIWSPEFGHQFQILDGHGDSVNSVSFSPDGKHIVSGSSDRTVRVWDVEINQQLQMLDGRGESLNCVAFSPDGERIASGSSDNIVQILDAGSGQQLQLLKAHGFQIKSPFSPDSSPIVFSSLRIRDTESSQQLQELNGHESGINSVAFSPDSTRIVFSSLDKAVRIWDIKSGQQLQKLDGHASGINSVAFSPDGERIVSGSSDETVRIWDVESGQQLQDLKGHGDQVNSVAFSPDGKCVVSGSGSHPFFVLNDNTVRIWDAMSGKQLQKLNGHGSSVNSVAFSPDSEYVVSGSSDNTVRIWDAEAGRQFQQLVGHGSGINSVGCSPDGKYVVSGSADKTVRIWDVESGQQLRRFDSYVWSVNSVTFSPDGKRVVSGTSGSTVQIWDVECGRKIDYLQSLVKSVSFDLPLRFGIVSREHYRHLDSNIDYPSARPLLTNSSSATSDSYTLHLSSTSTSNRILESGWVVTSGQYTASEHLLLWLPQSLRSFHTSARLVISESGFNKIDLSGCTFGDGWYNIYN
ncbi:WD40-repeat-containing domain protein [Flagelloscypha sp. PMI_526]|nr:WD40-repeat-containing domain protein [Flagelloscypha sp. PMI_526]